VTIDHTVHSFDNELKELMSKLYSMAELIANQMDIAISSWESVNLESYTECVEIDFKINKIDYDIEQFAYNLLALRQPMGIDLRIIVSALKLSVTLERMGDLLKSITSRACKVNDNTDKEINNQVVIILQKLSNLFITVRPLLKMEEIPLSPTDVSLKTTEIHQFMMLLYNQVIERIKNDVKHIDDYTNILFAIKSMERFSQAISKISRVNLYIKTGEKHLKHEIGPVSEEI
jgi:phosphate transport system protein